MDYKDYYSVLGVPRTASDAEIKKAFRKLARAHHPDLKPGDAEAERAFKEINEANEVLSDPEKRKRYDALGADWERYGAAGGPFGAGSPFGAGFAGTSGFGPGGVRYEFRTGGDAEGFSDFFRMFFSGGAGPGSEGAAGTMGGGTSGSTFDLNDLFGGARTFGGGRTNRRTAPPRATPVEATVDLTLEEALAGTTRIVDVGGKRLEVKIPKGVDNGSRIRLGGKGGSGADARDLVLVTRVATHAIFGRQGNDLLRELELPFGVALLGGEVKVGTLTGAVLLNVPAGTQSGRTFRLKGQGMPALKAEGRGDLLVKVRVGVPTLETDDQRAAARAFLQTLGDGEPR